MTAQLEELNQCPVCQGRHYKAYLEAKDNTVSKENFQIVRCESCGFLYTNPRPSAASIGTYYESTDYISHHDEGKDLMSKIYTGVRNYTTRQKIKLLEESVGRVGTLLDIGSGTGFFLAQAKAVGWNVTGTEPDQQARRAGAARVGEEVFETIWDAPLASKTYDAITMWHVLEHVHLLNETFGWLHEHLNPEGRLFIAVPNPESVDAKRFRENWAAYDVPRHLYHFTRASMKQLAGIHGFKVERVLPMWFDSYYVSLLSSRYERGKSKVPLSLWEGTVSNWKGRSNAEGEPNTSSLIYILAKA